MAVRGPKKQSRTRSDTLAVATHEHPTKNSSRTNLKKYYALRDETLAGSSDKGGRKMLGGLVVYNDAFNGVRNKHS